MIASNQFFPKINLINSSINKNAIKDIIPARYIIKG